MWLSISFVTFLQRGEEASRVESAAAREEPPAQPEAAQEEQGERRSQGSAKLVAGKGSFTLRDKPMWYRTHDSLITFNNGLRTLKTKSGGGFFILRGPNPFLKVIKLSCERYHTVESRSLNGP